MCYTKQYKATEFFYAGYNTTQMNRQLIIRFRPKKGGKYASKRGLISAKKMFELIEQSGGDTQKKIDGLMSRVSTMGDTLRVNFRSWGAFEFAWR